MIKDEGHQSHDQGSNQSYYTFMGNFNNVGWDPGPKIAKHIFYIYKNIQCQIRIFSCEFIMNILLLLCLKLLNNKLKIGDSLKCHYYMCTIC